MIITISVGITFAITTTITMIQDFPSAFELLCRFFKTNLTELSFVVSSTETILMPTLWPKSLLDFLGICPHSTSPLG